MGSSSVVIFVPNLLDSMDREDRGEGRENRAPSPLRAHKLKEQSMNVNIVLIALSCGLCTEECRIHTYLTGAGVGC